jgi:hypothetical protein
MFVPCCHIPFNFNYISCRSYALIKILPREIFVSLFTEELHSGVHRWVYVYGCTTSHSALITFSVKMMCQTFVSGLFSLSFYQGITWQTTYAWISILCCHIKFSFNHIHCENYMLKFYQGEFLSQGLILWTCRLEYSYHVILHSHVIPLM